MFCSKCGKENPDNANFCRFCGMQIKTVVEESTIDNTVSNKQGENKRIVLSIASVLLCFAIIFVVVFVKKSPSEILIENKWYTDVGVSCSYNDWSSIGHGKGYWFNAWCKKIVFLHYGEAELTSYSIGGADGVYGPYSYEINSENIPSSASWDKSNYNSAKNWEILDENTLKYNGEYYLWDDQKNTHCDCGDTCKHNKTWFITKEYLRIGTTTYTSKKPQSLYIDD